MMHTMLLPARLGCARRLAAVAAAAAVRVTGIAARPRRAARHVPQQQQQQQQQHEQLLPDLPGRWGVRAMHQQARSSRHVRTAATGSSGPAATGGGQQQRAPKQQQEQLVPAAPLASAEEAFYAEAAGSFEELGIAPAVAAALKSAGFAKPSRVQELVVPRILSGSDVVVAAETGSGKTLAYIAPMATIMQAKAAAGQRPPGAADLLAAATSSSSSSTARPRQEQQQQQQQQAPRWMGLVLCPNTALCQQVVRLAASLTADDGRPLLRACHVSSSSPPPFDPPDIVVTTPGALTNLFNDRGYSYGSQWTAEGVAARAAFVVVDEADLLCQGGYAKDLTRLLDAFKASERRLIEAQVMAETGLDRDAFSRLPRHVKTACWEGGTPAMIEAGFKPSSSSSDEQQQQQDGASTSSSRRQGHGPYFSRQYLFVAATMPALTKGDVGIELQKRFKDAVWVSGDMLHQVKPHVTHTWVPVGCAAASAGGSADDRAVADDCLLQAITSDPDYQAGRARVLVFTTNTASADRVSALLQDRGVANLVYHKNLPAADQAAALAAMRQPLPSPTADGDAGDAADASTSTSGNLLLVSTDAAARGIDLPLVTHVIQADFASNAVEFLHRVGRTARAGRAGKVTSLYGRPDTVLAEALRRYVREGRPVEECFSRNRSFSRKVKRYGGFVPRGQEGPQQRGAAAAAAGDGAE